MRVWRRWRYLTPPAGKAVRQCLDFAQVNAALEGMGIGRERWPEIHRGLDVMESEALDALARQG